MEEGKALIEKMKEKLGRDYWTTEDVARFLIDYPHPCDSPYIKFWENDVRLDGTFDIAMLEAILIAMYGEK